MSKPKVPAPPLELNHGRMSAWPRSKSETCQWYTVEVGKLGNIHIHNDTPSGRWTYKIITVWELSPPIGKTFDGKDAAYQAAWTRFLRMIMEVIAN